MSQTNTVNQAKLQLPKPGHSLPAGVPLNFAFTSTLTSISINLTVFQQQGNIGGVSSMFVDNTGTGSGILTIAFGQSGQALQIPPGAQAYLPVLAPNPLQVTASMAGGATVTASVVLLNYLVMPCVWVP